MIRREEALGLRIRAAPPIRGETERPLNLVQPGRGQTYFKLTGDEAAPFLLQESRELTAELTGDRAAFFDHWLTETYRQQRFQRSSGNDEAVPLVVGFPVLFDATRGQLMTLLRFSTEELSFVDAAGEAWSAPKARERQRGTVPVPPAALRLASEKSDEEPPYALDENVLSRVLGVQEELVGQVANRLVNLNTGSPIDVLQWTLGLLRAEPGDEVMAADDAYETAAEWVAAVTSAVRDRLLQSSTRVWPMGLAYDGGAIWATHYLQQDLRDLIRGRAEPKPWSALKSYLSGRRLRGSLRAHVGRRGDRVPTPAQRHAAQRFLGSRITAVQGPPGTGKTELILGLCAHALIERMSRTGSGDVPKAPTRPVLVVTSTNNRAVDNVVDPLSHALPSDRLPIALRVGSRPVMEAVTLPLLLRTRTWLRRSDPAAARAVYDEARERVTTAMDAIRAAEDAVKKAEQQSAQLEATEERCVRLRERIDRAQALATELGLDAETLVARVTAVKLAHERFADFERHLKAKLTPLLTAKKPRVARARKAWAASAEGVNDELIQSLAAVGLTLDMGHALGDDAALTEWLEAFDRLTDTLADLSNALADQDEDMEAVKGIAELDTLQASLREADTNRVALAAKPSRHAESIAELAKVVEEHESGLFEVATGMREAWAALSRDRLLPSLDSVINALRSNPSLRRMAQRDSSAWDDILRLFPVVGTTLLSMGNVFPMEEGIIDRVIIDEAGQCHPAHAISALHRADRALIIGDVHQLEPVIELDEREEARVIRRLGKEVQAAQLEPYRVTASAGNSAQTLAERASALVPRLVDHFRCQPAIIAVSDALCDYELQVRTPLRSLDGLLSRGALLGCSIAGIQAPFLGSWRNDAEVALVVRLLRRLRRDRIRPEQIAVLTPYRGQLRALQTALRAAGLPLEDRDVTVSDAPTLFETRPAGGIAIGTVHRFQGGERDVVILSTVASRPSSLAFTNTRVNLINVAVSRAKQHLVVVGDPTLLARGRVTRTLVEAIPTEGWLDVQEI